MKSMSRLAVVVCVSLVAASLAVARPAFVLPDILYAAPGVECNVYYDGAFETVTPWRYAYEAECPVGRCERFRWHWTPAAEDAGRSVPLVLRALDDDGTVAERSVTVRVARLPKAPDTRRITLAMLGASISNSGYPQRVMKLMRENGYPNYTPVGSHAGGGKPVVPGGIAYDGYGGFQWGDFLRRWWARECELPQEQMKAEEEALRLGQREFVIQQGDAYRLKSPLLRVGASGRPELDLQGWLDRINGGKPPDVITVALFGNDMFKARPGTLQAHLDRTFADAERLLSVLRAAAPKAHIGVGLGVAAADQDAFAKNYGCLQSAAQYRRNIFAFNRRMMAFDFIRRDGNMSLIPMNAAIDTVNSFPRAEVAAHADTTQTVWRTSNALHPLRCGGDQLGDAIFAWLADVLSRGPAARRVSVADCGAVPDGRTPCTAAFAKAVAACAEGGGGRVVVPAGTWFTGPIHLENNVDLHLEEGAVVEFSDDPKDCLPAVPSSWEGLECLNLSPLVYAYCRTNVAITGKGVLRPRMAFWREMMKEENTDIQGARAILYKWGSEDHPVEKRDITKAHPAVLRPQCIQFNRCKGIRIEDVRIEDSPFWTIHLYQSEDVAIRRIDVCAHGFNNDGVDIEMTRNVLIEDSVFDQGDDGLVFKSGRNRDAWRVGRPTENVEARNCRFKTVGSLIGVGSELSGGVRNVYVHDCTVEAACNLFYVKTNYRRGGFVENICMENVQCDLAAQVFAVDTDVLYQWRKFPDYETRLTPITGLYMKNVICDRARTGVNINGDARLPVRNVRLEGVRIGRVQDFPSRVQYAENVDLAGLSCDGRGKVETPWDKDFDPTAVRSATK